jgi:hypothetical protein
MQEFPNNASTFFADHALPSIFVPISKNNPFWKWIGEDEALDELELGGTDDERLARVPGEIGRKLLDTVEELRRRTGSGTFALSLLNSMPRDALHFAPTRTLESDNVPEALRLLVVSDVIHREIDTWINGVGRPAGHAVRPIGLEGSPETQPPLGARVVAWDPHVRASHEFRVFVRGDLPVVASQRHADTHFEAMEEELDALRPLVWRYARRVAAKLLAVDTTFPAYLAIDLFVSRSRWRLVGVTEVHPERCSPVLFEWDELIPRLKEAPAPNTTPGGVPKEVPDSFEVRVVSPHLGVGIRPSLAAAAGLPFDFQSAAHADELVELMQRMQAGEEGPF